MVFNKKGISYTPTSGSSDCMKYFTMAYSFIYTSMYDNNCYCKCCKNLSSVCNVCTKTKDRIFWQLPPRISNQYDNWGGFSCFDKDGNERVLWTECNTEGKGKGDISHVCCKHFDEGGPFTYNKGRSVGTVNPNCAAMFYLLYDEFVCATSKKRAEVCASDIADVALCLCGCGVVGIATGGP